MEYSTHVVNGQKDIGLTNYVMTDHDLFNLAGTATIRCKADVGPETIFFTQHLQHKDIWTHERKFTKPVSVQFEWTEFDPF